jgi:hypothetical protein
VNFKAAGLANIVIGAFLTSSRGTAELPMCQSWWQQSTAREKVDFAPLQGQTKEIQPRMDR